MIEIWSRYGGRVLYTAETAVSVREAVEEAVRNGVSLKNADLVGADLRGVKAHGADLRYTILRGADLRGADFTDTDLRDANLRGAKAYGADFRGANLHRAALRRVYLGCAGLDVADGLTFSAGPSGDGHLIPLDADGRHDRAGEWRITIGCERDRPLDYLRDIIADRVEWPEAKRWPLWTWASSC